MSNESVATHAAVTGMCHLCNGWGDLADGDTCPRCVGVGRLTGPPCPVCGGTGGGWIPITSYKGYARCSRCDGSGVDPQAWAVALLAYGQAELARLQDEPVTCWRCGEEIPDDPDLENCPHCGADLVPF